MLLHITYFILEPRTNSSAHYATQYLCPFLPTTQSCPRRNNTLPSSWLSPEPWPTVGHVHRVLGLKTFALACYFSKTAENVKTLADHGTHTWMWPTPSAGLRSDTSCRCQMFILRQIFFVRILSRRLIQQLEAVSGLQYEYNVMIKTVIAGGGVTTMPER